MFERACLIACIGVKEIILRGKVQRKVPFRLRDSQGGSEIYKAEFIVRLLNGLIRDESR